MSKKKLQCKCGFLGRYQGESGKWWCEACGGLTDPPDKRKPEEIVQDKTLIGTAAVSCHHCNHLNFIQGDTSSFCASNRQRRKIIITCTKCGQDGELPSDWRIMIK